MAKTQGGKTANKAEAPKAEAPKTEKKTTGIGNIVKEEYRKKYGKGGNCGDALATAMKAADEVGHDYQKVAIENGVDIGRWAHLNAGQQRMNLSNVLRAKMRKGEDVTVNGKKVDKSAYVEAAEAAKKASAEKKSTKKAEGSNKAAKAA